LKEEGKFEKTMQETERKKEKKKKNKGEE